MGKSLTKGVCPECGTIINAWGLTCSDLLACPQCGWCRQDIKPAYQQAGMPVITLQPVSEVSVAVDGTAVELEITATGTGEVTYQWYSNATAVVEDASAISGETDDSYTPPVDEAGVFYYFCRVKNTELDDYTTLDTDICTYTVTASEEV